MGGWWWVGGWVGGGGGEGLPGHPLCPPPLLPGCRHKFIMAVWSQPPDRFHGPLPTLPRPHALLPPVSHPSHLLDEICVCPTAGNEFLQVLDVVLLLLVLLHLDDLRV